MSVTPKIVIGNYELGELIGKGTFGKVCKAMHIPTQFNVAVKILDRSLIVQEADFERVSRQIKILRKIRHKNVIQLYEVIETQEYLYLVTELASHDMFTEIVEKKKLTELMAAHYFKQLLNGLQYCHDNNICHRDIKPENLLISKDREIKITDFGLSNIFDKDFLRTACGSPCYAPPQMLQKKLYDPKLVDIWSSGVTLFAMVFGTLPFDDPNLLDLYRKIKKGDFQMPQQGSSDLKHFLLQMLQVNPSNRPSIKQLLQHPWLTKDSNQVVTDNQWIIQSIIDQVCEVYEFDKDILRSNLKDNRHNNITTTYYLSKLIIEKGGSIKKSQSPKITPNSFNSFIVSVQEITSTVQQIKLESPTQKLSQESELQPCSIQEAAKILNSNLKTVKFQQKQNKSPNQNDHVLVAAFNNSPTIDEEQPREPPQQIKPEKPTIITLKKISRMKPQFMKKTATQLNERSVSRAPSISSSRAVSKPNKPKHTISAPNKIISTTQKPQIMSPNLIFIGNKYDLKQFMTEVQQKSCLIQYYPINNNIQYITKYDGKNLSRFLRKLQSRLQ